METVIEQLIVVLMYTCRHDLYVIEMWSCYSPQDSQSLTKSPALSEKTDPLQTSTKQGAAQPEAATPVAIPTSDTITVLDDHFLYSLKDFQPFLSKTYHGEFRVHFAMLSPYVIVVSISPPSLRL